MEDSRYRPTSDSNVNKLSSIPTGTVSKAILPKRPNDIPPIRRSRARQRYNASHLQLSCTHRYHHLYVGTACGSKTQVVPTTHFVAWFTSHVVHHVLIYQLYQELVREIETGFPGQVPT